MAIQFRRALAATWTAVNPVLADGQPGVEKDTGQVKVGDGVSAWNALDYVGTGALADGAVLPSKLAAATVALFETPAGATGKADAAESNAVSAAATDATSKANAARTTAISTAASDATSKADAAQAAAIAAAATDATTKANSARTGAVSDVTPRLAPTGGTNGQIVGKNAGAIAWVDVPDGSLPAGGTDGQILAKSGSTGVWTDAPPSTPADGSITPAKLAPTVTQDAVPDGTTAKQFTNAKDTKLSGVATGATANRSDAATDSLLAGKETAGAAAAAQAAAISAAAAASKSADLITDGTTKKAFLATERTKLTALPDSTRYGDDLDTKADAVDLDAIDARVGVAETAIDALPTTSEVASANKSADTITDGTTKKAFLATERTKLTGIAVAATANQSDATTNAAIAAAVTTAATDATTKDKRQAALRIPASGAYIIGKSLRAAGTLAGTTTAVHSRVKFYATRDVDSIVIRYDNWSLAGTTQPIKIRASLDLLGGVSVAPAPSGPVTVDNVRLAHFQGEDASGDVTVAANGSAYGYVAISLAAGTAFWINTRAVPVGTSAIPSMSTINRFSRGLTGEVCEVQTTGTVNDYTRNPTTYTSASGGANTPGYGPTVVLGESKSWIPTWGVAGDSISENYNDSFVGGDDNSLSGWPLRALGATRGVMNQSRLGYKTNQFVPEFTWQSLYGDCSHVIYALQQNDLDGTQSTDQLKDMYRQAWSLLKRQGVRCVIGITGCPNTTTTDGHTTVEGQTPGRPVAAFNANTQYAEICDWILTVPDPLDGVLDMRSIVGTKKADGVTWVWQPSMVQTATNGIHPNRAGHMAIAAAVQANLATWEAI